MAGSILGAETGWQLAGYSVREGRASSFLKTFKILFIAYGVGACVCNKELRWRSEDTLVGVGSIFPSCGSCGFNSDVLGWRQAPPILEPRLRSRQLFPKGFRGVGSVHAEHSHRVLT